MNFNEYLRKKKPLVQDMKKKNLDIRGNLLETDFFPIFLLRAF